MRRRTGLPIRRDARAAAAMSTWPPLSGVIRPAKSTVSGSPPSTTASLLNVENSGSTWSRRSGTPCGSSRRACDGWPRRRPCSEPATLAVRLPSDTLHHRSGRELAASPRKVERETRKPKRAVADLGGRKGVHLEPADAGAEVSVQHLHDGPVREQPAVDLERAHVVRKADVGPPLAEIGQDRVEASIFNAERDVRFIEKRALALAEKRALALAEKRALAPCGEEGSRPCGEEGSRPCGEEGSRPCGPNLRRGLSPLRKRGLSPSLRRWYKSAI